MRVIPKRLVEMLWFFAGRVDRWAEDPAAIGIDTPTVDGIRDAVLAMEAARAEAGRARLAAERASTEYHSRAEALRSLGSKAVGRIKAHAQDEGGVAVYTAAGLPIPARPGKGAAPGRPTRLRATLIGGGSLRIDWQCDNGRARGVMYEVRRSVDGGPFEFLDAVGRKRFADHALPSGTGVAIYRVTAARVAGRAGHSGSAMLRGEPVDHIVRIGTQNVDEARAAA